MVTLAIAVIDVTKINTCVKNIKTIKSGDIQNNNKYNRLIYLTMNAFLHGEQKKIIQDTGYSYYRFDKTLYRLLDGIVLVPVEEKGGVSHLNDTMKSALHKLNQMSDINFELDNKLDYRSGQIQLNDQEVIAINSFISQNLKTKSNQNGVVFSCDVIKNYILQIT